MSQYESGDLDASASGAPFAGTTSSNSTGSGVAGIRGAGDGD